MGYASSGRAWVGALFVDPRSDGVGRSSSSGPMGVRQGSSMKAHGDYLGESYGDTSWRFSHVQLPQKSR